jgi:phospholipase C
MGKGEAGKPGAGDDGGTFAGGTNPDGTDPDGTDPDGTDPDRADPDGTNPDRADPDGTDSDHVDPGVEPPPPPPPSRRSFLKATGIAAASGFIVGGAAGGATGALIGANLAGAGPAQDFPPLIARSEPGFDHVVVLMFENRSFDNLLGWLYRDDELAAGQKFNGLHQGSYSNLAPDGTKVEAHVYTGATDVVMSHPDPDPGEFYPHVNTQLFNVIDPGSNADMWRNGIAAPYNAPADQTRPTMSGFVSDYIVNFRDVKRGLEPNEEQYRVAMGGFSPEMLPVTSTLAKRFAVYDNWFAAVPSQTFCNRSFFHASTSNGFVTNQLGGGYDKWLDASYAASVFNRLEDAGVSWRVYYDADQLASFTGILHAPAIQKYWKSNFRGMAQFHQDAKNGTLPAYSFIEPRMVFNHNDMHPPFGQLRESFAEGHEIFDSALSDVRAGEVLLSEVYTSIRKSASTHGSNALNTVFLVTFDEHGGTFDHVPPPRVTTPTGTPEAGEMGFTFDRLGCRVPAIVISAYTRAGTVINDEMHHGSLISTLNRVHGLAPLGRRDATANTLFNAVNLETPRQPAFWPDTHASFVPPNPESLPKPHETHRERPLTPPAEGLLGLLLAKYDPKAPVPRSYGDAYDALVEHGTGLFGVSD